MKVRVEIARAKDGVNLRISDMDWRYLADARLDLETVGKLVAGIGAIEIEVQTFEELRGRSS